MAKRDEPYVYVVVESYYPASTAGLHGPIHVRPVEGQPFPTHLHVECSKALVDPTKHPVGTSRAFPKFESYGMPETAAFRGWKAQDAIEWFHGIGRLGSKFEQN